MVDETCPEARKPQAALPRVRPATDIIERDDGFYLYMDMPGLGREDLSLQVKDGTLTVRGRTSYASASEERFIECEFGNGEYLRTFTLTEAVDKDNIKAHFENGVLEIFMPRAPKAGPLRIEVTTSE